MFLLFASLASVITVIRSIRKLLVEGSDESSSRCLQRFFFFLILLFFDIESNEDVSDESDNAGSGSGFTSGSCSFSFFSENSVGCVSSSESIGRVSSSKTVDHVSGIFSVSRVSGMSSLGCVS